jgi:hypothetical protein
VPNRVSVERHLVLGRHPLLYCQQPAVGLLSDTPHRNQRRIKAPHGCDAKFEGRAAPDAIKAPERLLQVRGVQVGNRQDMCGQQAIV